MNYLLFVTIRLKMFACTVPQPNFDLIIYHPNVIIINLTTKTILMIYWFKHFVCMPICVNRLKGYNLALANDNEMQQWLLRCSMFAINICVNMRISLWETNSNKKYYIVWLPCSCGLVYLFELGKWTLKDSLDAKRITSLSLMRQMRLRSPTLELWAGVDAKYNANFDLTLSLNQINQEEKHF